MQRFGGGTRQTTQQRRKTGESVEGTPVVVQVATPQHAHVLPLQSYHGVPVLRCVVLCHQHNKHCRVHHVGHHPRSVHAMLPHLHLHPRLPRSQRQVGVVAYAGQDSTGHGPSHGLQHAPQAHTERVAY